MLHSAGLLSNWLRDEQSPLLAPLSTELREQRAAALRRGMVPPQPHIHTHRAHYGNGTQTGVEERGGGGGGVPPYAYGLLGAAAVPAGVMMADAVAGGDKDRSRGGPGEERGLPFEDEEEESEDEYGRSVSAHTPHGRAIASEGWRPFEGRPCTGQLLTCQSFKSGDPDLSEPLNRRPVPGRRRDISVAWPYALTFGAW